MINKKAIVLPEVLKLVIAVFCIILLLYLAFGLYGIFTRGSEIEQAKAILEDIAGKGKALANGAQAQYLITNLKDWSIFSFKEEESKPSSCGDSNCLCLCKEGKQDCFKTGQCKSTKEKFYFYQQGFEQYDNIYPCFVILKTPLNLLIKNDSGNILIYSEEYKLVGQNIKLIDILSSSAQYKPQYDSNVHDADISYILGLYVDEPGGVYSNYPLNVLNEYFSEKTNSLAFRMEISNVGGFNSNSVITNTGMAFGWDSSNKVLDLGSAQLTSPNGKSFEVKLKIWELGVPECKS